MAGEWDSPDLVAVLVAMARHLDTLVPPPLQGLRRLYEGRQPAAEDNDRVGARRNIARHYDLSNDLFGAFLDKTMTYSSGLFADPRESLEQAQARKIDRLLDATNVDRRLRVLEIGTGWGGSRFEHATRRPRHHRDAVGRTGRPGAPPSRAAGLTARSRCGWRTTATSRLLRRGGQRRDDRSGRRPVVARHPPNHRGAAAIGGRVARTGDHDGHGRLLATQSSWTRDRQVRLPWRQNPSEQAISEALGAHTSLAVTDRATLRRELRHHPATLAERFNDNSELVDGLGFDRTFRRMWNFYLAYSEAGFDPATSTSPSSSFAVPATADA